MSTLDTEAIAQRLASRQPGKWSYGSHGRTVVCDNDSYETFVAIAEMRHPSPWQRISDAEFIAAAPGDIAALLAEVARLETVANKQGDTLEAKWREILRLREALKPLAAQDCDSWGCDAPVGHICAPRHAREVLGVSRLTEEPK